MISRIESVTSYVLFELVGSVIRFPFWWYGEGLHDMIEWSREGLRYRWRSYGIALWVKHFFVPMYGAYDWPGRLISVLVRFVMIIARCFAIVVEAMVYAVLLFLWLFAPLFVVSMFLLSLFQGTFLTFASFGAPAY
ncbi:MAG: hypothetical protein WCV84_00545 [Patescibacteria group bacterium]